MATLAVSGLRESIFSSAIWVKSDLTLVEGKPFGRVQEVVLSTYPTATDFAPFRLFLISLLDKYLADIVGWNRLGESRSNDERGRNDGI